MNDSLPSHIDRLFADWQEPGAPGGVVALIQDGAILYQQAYGLADLERQVPLTTDFVFDIGSTSKQFVAFCVLLLAHAGRVDLDDDIRRFLPELPVYDGPISIRHLIHHTSGIRDYLTLMRLAGLPFENDYEVAALLALIARQRGLNFLPGDEYLYSNSGYLLLGELVRRVAGRSLNDFAREQIFAPLEMNRTCFYDDFKRIVPWRAIGYAPAADNGFTTELYLFDIVGDGGLLTTVGDLARWDENFYASRLAGGPALMAQMLATRPLNDGQPNAYACGLSRRDYRGLQLIEHAGAWAGYRAEMIRFPEQRCSVIVLANRADANPTLRALQIADRHLADHLDRTPGRPGATLAGPLPTAEAQALAGRFRNPRTGSVITLSFVEDALTFTHPSGFTSPLMLVGEGQLQATAYPELLVSYSLQPDARPQIRLMAGASEEHLLEAVPPLELNGTELAAYAGQFHSEELDVTYELAVSAGDLHVRLPFREQGDALTPTVADEFNGELGTFVFTRDDRGRIDGLSLRAGRVKDLRFRRLAA